MEKDIQNFSKQFEFSPEIKNKEKWGGFQDYFLSGMGGSHLQGNVFKAIYPDFPLFLHQNYGLPLFHNGEKTGFVIASYSGNTEEVIDVYNKALSEGLSVIVISKGGHLLADAKKKELPHIELPQDEIEPRIAIGYSYKALSKAVGVEKVEKEAENTVDDLMNEQPKLKQKAEELVSLLENKIPIVYATERNRILASMWKINFNETTKIPSFYNVIPELNHNEMTGFDVNSSTKELSEKMVFVLLKDSDDYSKNRKRTEALKKVLRERDLQIIEVEVEGKSRTEKVFKTILLSEWTSYLMAGFYGTNYKNSPMIENFKGMI